MNTQQPYFHLLSVEVSRLCASAKDPADSAAALVELLETSLPGAQAGIRLSHAADPHLAEAGHHRVTAQPRLARAIEVRGEVYGELQLSAPPEVFADKDFTAFIDLLVQHLARLAELDLHRRRNDELLSQSRDLQWSLNLDKLLSRATGIISAVRRIRQREALEWLREESRRQHVPVWQLADRLVEGQRLSHRFGQEQRPAPLRKTA